MTFWVRIFSTKHLSKYWGHLSLKVVQINMLFAISTNISDYIVPFMEDIRWLPLYNLSTKMKIMIFEIHSLKTVWYRWILFIIISQYFWNGTRLLHQVTLVLIDSSLNYLHPSKTFTETAEPAIILNGSLLYVQVAFIFKCFPQSHFIGSVAT